MRGLALVGVAAMVAALHGCTPMQQQRVESAERTATHIAAPLDAALGAVLGTVEGLDGVKPSIREGLRQASGYLRVGVSIVVDLIRAVQSAATADERADIKERLAATLPSVTCAMVEIVQLLTMAGVEVPAELEVALGVFGWAVGDCDA